ncbi:MAG: YqhA family protein [Proteobacteria bacterium]|nr:YqhA family protein [Pseudomonadota bacterium]
MTQPNARSGPPMIPRLLFMSRWLQLPLYLGLILALGVYVFHFWKELVDLTGAAMGNQAALQHLLEAVAVRNPLPPEGALAVASAHAAAPTLTETTIMLVVLSLIDVVMIANLLIMVIIGGYETFVSRMYLEGHPDHPEWLSHVNASVLKVKLAMAIIGISSIHLLRTFINADAYSVKALVAQTTIHLTFLASAVAIAYTDRVMSGTIHDYQAAQERDADRH